MAEAPRDNFHIRERILWLAEQAFGSVVHETERRARGSHQGKPVWVESADRELEQDQVLVLAVPLPDLPVRFQLSKKNPSVVRLSGPASCATGDPSFDAVMELSCEPPELVAAFDARVRQWLMTSFEPVGPVIGAGGRDRIALRWPFPNGGVLASQQVPAATPEMLQTHASGLQYLAERLNAEHARLYESIVGSRGPEAAATWLAGQQSAAALSDAGDRRRPKNVVLIVSLVVVLLVVVPCLAVVLLAVLSTLLRA